MKEARHLAQLNVGRLRAEPGDPAVAEFMGALDRVNGIGKRSPGFVWMMEGSGEPGTGNTDAKIDGDPRHVFNLTVWTDVESLEHFVWNTVHRQFYRRRKAWFEVLDEPHFRHVVGAGRASAVPARGAREAGPPAARRPLRRGFRLGLARSRAALETASMCRAGRLVSGRYCISTGVPASLRHPGPRAGSQRMVGAMERNQPLPALALALVLAAGAGIGGAARASTPLAEDEHVTRSLLAAAVGDKSPAGMPHDLGAGVHRAAGGVGIAPLCTLEGAQRGRYRGLPRRSRRGTAPAAPARRIPGRTRRPRGRRGELLPVGARRDRAELAGRPTLARGLNAPQNDGIRRADA